MRQALFLLSIIAFVLSGCAGKERIPAGSIVITLWTASNPYEIKWAKHVVEEWSRENPHVIIKSQPIPEGTSSEEILMASVLAGTTPDICANLSPTIVEQFRQAHALVCIDDHPELRRYIEERVPEEPLKGFFSPDGRLYQVPWKCNPVLMFYNRKICDSIGALPPATYSEWLAMAHILREKMPGVSMTQFDSSSVWHKRFFDFFTLYIAASGGKTLLNEEGRIDVDNETAISVIEFLRENFKEGYSTIELIPGQPFVQGQIATYVSGTWNVAALALEAPEIEYDVAPVPVPDDYDFKIPVHTFADPKCIGIFSSTKHPAECAEFVRFMCSRSMDARLASECGQLPYRKDMLRDEEFRPVFQKVPKLRKFAESVPYTRSMDQSLRLMELFDAFAIEYVDVAVRNIRTPEEGLRRAQRRMEEIAR